MSTLNTVIASLPSVQLSLGALLKKLQRKGRLRPLVIEALAEELVRQEARQAGLSVSAEELQTAADTFRRDRGLHTAADTHAWLAGQELSVDDFETGLEESLLAAKLKQHLSARVDDTEVEVLQLAMVRVERDDLARELASQVRDDGRDLEAVARENGLTLGHPRLLRTELVVPLAEALASAQPGELVGPVGTPEGFALVMVEECGRAELDAATRQRIQKQVFDDWLTVRMKEAVIDQGMLGTSA